MPLRFHTDQKDSSILDPNYSATTDKITANYKTYVKFFTIASWNIILISMPFMKLFFYVYKFLI